MNKINDIDDINTFIHAGNSRFTVNNTETNNRYTFNIKQSDDKNVWFIRLLTSPNRYTYIGIINRSMEALVTKTSKFSQDSTPIQVMNWLLKHCRSQIPLPPQVNFYHEGKCGKCGRSLTTPESIESGYGPVCKNLIQLSLL